MSKFNIENTKLIKDAMEKSKLSLSAVLSYYKSAVQEIQHERMLNPAAYEFIGNELDEPIKQKFEEKIANASNVPAKDLKLDKEEEDFSKEMDETLPTEEVPTEEVPIEEKPPEVSDEELSNIFGDIEETSEEPKETKETTETTETTDDIVEDLLGPEETEKK